MIPSAELQQSPFLDDLAESDRAHLAQIGVPTHWMPGEAIFTARSPAKYLYILKSGSILLCFPNGRSFVVREPGQLLGWSSLVSPFHYTATGLCLTESTLFQFPNSELYKLFQMDAGLGQRIMQKIATVMQERRPYRTRTVQA
ncbi:Cyclic nucleotide-binding domain-containing protein [Desulfacinum hydrothermale DSM 13146]|uniref:Cyclic nucleotide-binding domain-containing protein n=1 Tax=Desulfacinum hydrothermale DSM 13146 TaxID=1121390 RepID=A0A1W1XN35_9BACT|nr:Crp/Fnr family transcriptional regulator [Desulfacinum hydrothermale]SMC25274.1 Cyclic nucleotide-binding domain-containing protein [Desulfacinum hydrothermale DSM 13146]